MSKKQIIGIVIFVVLIGVVVGIGFLGGRGEEDQGLLRKNLTTVYVATGGGKEDFINDEEIIKNKVQKQVVQKKETVVKKSEEKTVETKTEIEDNSTPEEENEESHSLSKSAIDFEILSQSSVYFVV